MTISLENIINKTVLVGISYFDKNGDPLQQRQLSGVVVETDAEKGIAVKLLQASPHTKNAETDKAEEQQPEHFVLPASLNCWFHAPEGNYKDPETGQSISNPDFLVTWDVYQNQEEVEEGTHQWWEWRPRTTPPMVGSK